jgi:hypothetical protein
MGVVLPPMVIERTRQDGEITMKSKINKNKIMKEGYIKMNTKVWWGHLGGMS